MRNPICWSTGSFFSAFFSWAGGSLSSFCHPPPLQPSATSACTGGQRLVGEEPTMNSSICFRISAACPAAAFCPRSGPRSIVLQVLIIKARPFSFKCNTSCRILTELGAGPGERWHSELESRKLQPCAPTHLVSRSYKAGRRASACRIKVMHEARLMLRVSTNETERQW